MTIGAIRDAHYFEFRKLLPLRHDHLLHIPVVDVPVIEAVEWMQIISMRGELE